MPRKPTGPRALTNAEKQVRQRAARNERIRRGEEMRAALAAVLAAQTLHEAREIAARGLGEGSCRAGIG